MPIICRRKSDLEIMTVSVKDIPSGILIRRMAKEEGRTEDEFEEVNLTQSEFDAEMQAYSDAHPKPPDPEIPEIDSFVEKMKGIGFTKSELEVMFPYKKGKIK